MADLLLEKFHVRETNCKFPMDEHDDIFPQVIIIKQ